MPHLKIFAMFYIFTHTHRHRYSHTKEFKNITKSKKDLYYVISSYFPTSSTSYSK